MDSSDQRPAGRGADCRVDGLSTDETVQGVDLGGRAAVSGGRRCRRLKMVGTMPREPITNLYRGLFDVACGRKDASLGSARNPYR